MPFGIYTNIQNGQTQLATKAGWQAATRRSAGRRPVARDTRTIALAVERLLADRERVRKNRQATKELLRSYRPDLFDRAKDATQTTLVSYAHKEQVCKQHSSAQCSGIS